MSLVSFVATCVSLVSLLKTVNGASSATGNAATICEWINSTCTFGTTGYFANATDCEDRFTNADISIQNCMLQYSLDAQYAKIFPDLERRRLGLTEPQNCMIVANGGMADFCHTTAEAAAVTVAVSYCDRYESWCNDYNTTGYFFDDYDDCVLALLGTSNDTKSCYYYHLSVHASLDSTWDPTTNDTSDHCMHASGGPDGTVCMYYGQTPQPTNVPTVMPTGMPGSSANAKISVIFCFLAAFFALFSQ
jgi:hypothetical protein